MPLDVKVEDGIATLVINRPEAMNAMDPETRTELIQALDRVHQDDAIQVAILTGAGDRSFCTGSDLKKTNPPKESFAAIKLGQADNADLMAAFDIVGKPLICAVNGYALGGGLEYALACDIRIASENARFGLAEVRIGSIPGFAGTQRLPRTVGPSDAMMMLLTGDHVDAQEALRIGIVSRVVTSDALLPEARAIADRIKKNAPLAVRAVKRLVKLGMDMPLKSAIDYESFVWGALRDTEDRLEGRQAFKEKRPPQYKGR